MKAYMYEIISKLYESTLTPHGYQDDLYKKEVRELINYILKSSSNLHNFSEISKQKIEEIILFILKLVNTPCDLNGVILIEPCIKHLVDATCNEIDALPDYKEIIMQVISDWFIALRKSPKAKKQYSKKPEIENAPLFRFHLDAYKDSTIKNTTIPSLYIAYALKFHKAIRSNEKQEINPNTHLSYVRAARYFFRFLPHNIKTRSEHPDSIPDDYMESFGRGYDEAEKRNYDDPLSDTAEEYINKIKKLLNYHPIIPRISTGRCTHTRKIRQSRKKRDAEYIAKAEPLNGGVTVLSDDGYLPNIKKLVDSDNFDEDTEIDDELKQSERFEAKHEIERYNIDSDDQRNPIVSKKPSIGKRFEDLINLRNFHFYWDSHYLNLFHYAILYKVLNEVWGKSQYYNSVVIFLYVLIHTGIPAHKLFDLQTSDNNPTEESISLLKNDNRYYIEHPSIVNLARIDENPNCLKTSNIVKVPLPMLICRLLSKTLINSCNYVFSYPENINKIKRLSIIDIENFIEKHINKPYSQYDLKITLPKITSSFMPLYHHCFGLDPILCCYISGEDRHRLYRSQMHYIRIEHEELEKKYLKTFDLVHSAICNNLNECISLKYIDNGTYSESEEFLNDSKDIHNHETGEIYSTGYGSTIIPHQEYVSDMLRTLKKTIRDEKNVIKRHNLFTIYSYLCLQFSTGLRPRNDPDITFDDYNEETGFISIRDKQSIKYHEERFLPLSETTNLLLNRLKKGLKDLKTFIAKYHYPPVLKNKHNKLFFFVDEETGKFEKFTLKKMREYLKNIGINYTLPLNMPRHYIRNYIYHKGLSNDIADIWMGHQHAGKEALNIASSAILSDISKISLPIIEEMLNQLEFADMKYLYRQILYG